MQNVMFEQSFKIAKWSTSIFSFAFLNNSMRKARWIALFYCLGNKLREVIGPAQSHIANGDLDNDLRGLASCLILWGCDKGPGRCFSHNDCKSPREMKTF